MAALDYLVGGLLQGGVFALVALGIALVYRVTGAVNLAQGAFVVLGAFVLDALEVAWGWPLWAALLGTIAAASVVGAAVAWAAFEPALRRLPPSAIVILTAGLLTTFEGLFLIVFGSQPYQVPPFSGTRPLVVGALHAPSQSVWIALALGVVVTSAWYVLQRTRLGRALRAASENPDAATLMGVDVRRLRIGSYVVASALGALAGAVVGPIVSLQFDGGRFFTIAGFIAVALGGLGSLVGAVVGGLGLGVIEQFAAGYGSSFVASTLALVLLLVVLIVRPRGLFATGAGRREDVREATPHAHRRPFRISARLAVRVGLAGLVLLSLAPLVPGSSAWLGTLVVTLVLFLAVLGLDVLMGFAGQVSLGHAGFVAIGAYGAAIATTRFGLAPLVGIALALIVSLATGAALARITARLRGLYLALATLAFGLLIDALVTNLGQYTGGPSGLTGIPPLSIGAVSFENPIAQYELLLALGALGVAALANIARSDLGRSLRAVRADQTAARALGIDVVKTKTTAFLIAAGFASVAGSLYAFTFRFLAPEMVSTARSIDLLTMLVVGGEGTLIGGLFGTALLTGLPTIVQPLAQVKTLITGLILVLTLLYAPGGIAGGFAALASRLRRRAA